MFKNNGVTILLYRARPVHVDIRSGIELLLNLEVKRDGPGKKKKNHKRCDLDWVGVLLAIPYLYSKCKEINTRTFCPTIFLPPASFFPSPDQIKEENRQLFAPFTFCCLLHITRI